MAKFPITRASERLDSAPLPRAALDVDTGGVGEAVSGLGASIAAIGEKFQQAKDMTDMTESETMILTQFDQLKSNYALDTDYSTMLTRWSKDADKIPDTLNKNVSGRVRRAREALFLKYRRQYAVKINDATRDLQISDGRAKHAEGLDMILRTGGRFAPDRAEALIRGTAAAGYISAEEAQRDRARILPEIAYYSAYDMIEAMPEDVEGIIKLHPDLNPGMKIQLRSLSERRMAMVKGELEAQREIDRDKLGVALNNGTIGYAMINSTSLDEKEQESYRIKMNAEAERRAKGIIIETDQRVKGELEAMAYDISTGAVTLPEFNRRLEDERYGKTPRIDDTTYDILKTLSETKFATYQATAMKERNTHALGQLVTLPNEEAFAEMLKRLTAKFDRDQAQTLRQLQFDNLDQYKKALRDWLKLNKDATGEEIYKEGRSMLVQYRKTPEQLRAENRGVVPVQKTRDIVPEELKSIWNNMTAEERLTALRALAIGKTGQEIRDFFESNR